MLEHLRAPFKRLIEPFAKALVSLGLTANAVTVIGAIGTIVVAFATGITGWLFAGAVVLTLLVLADSLDGSIAALTTGGTQFGAFLDSTLDRIADFNFDQFMVFIILGFQGRIRENQIQVADLVDLGQQSHIDIHGCCDCTEGIPILNGVGFALRGFSHSGTDVLH